MASIYQPEELVFMRERAERPTAEEVCNQFSERVYRFAAMLCRDATEAEDLAQDALVRAITRLDRFDPRRGDIEAWLWRIVTNLAKDAGRAAHRRQALVQVLSLKARRTEIAEHDEVIQIADEELLAAIRALDVRSRTLIALRFGADLDYPRIGVALGISPASARMATRRALSVLRSQLERTEAASS